MCSLFNRVLISCQTTYFKTQSFFSIEVYVQYFRVLFKKSNFMLISSLQANDIGLNVQSLLSVRVHTRVLHEWYVSPV